MGDLDWEGYRRAISKIIRMLLDPGIDVRLKYNRGRTAREVAMRKGFADRAALIEKRENA